MSRLSRAWMLSAVCALACDPEVTPSDTGGGAGSAGTNSAAGTTGSGSNAGGSANPSGGSASSAGSAGQNLGGSSAGGSNAGTGGSASGASQGGSAGNNGGMAGSGGATNPSLPKRVLLYSFSTLVIDSVPQQLTLLETQLKAWGYEVERSVKPDDLSTTNLARFGGVGMINTCFEPFGKGSMGDAQTAALKAFVEGGGGLFGTHCASVTFQSAEPPHPYNSVIGGRGGHGYFNGLSACRTMEAHATTDMLPATFDYTGDLDNADFVAEDSKVLVKCKWSGGDKKDTAVSWYRTPGKGRVFFTSFAKVDADLSDPVVGQKHIMLGLGWTLGR
ncbi:MAG TPA: ThuA domain-containing protein [Polyangiaceae bacterium]|nr:ThuA domain-containing protein [Polyangiaceae bacterium]